MKIGIYQSAGWTGETSGNSEKSGNGCERMKKKRFGRSNGEAQSIRAAGMNGGALNNVRFSPQLFIVILSFYCWVSVFAFCLLLVGVIFSLYLCALFNFFFLFYFSPAINFTHIFRLVCWFSSFVIRFTLWARFGRARANKTELFVYFFSVWW